jgi:replicative superfamily II helicase
MPELTNEELMLRMKASHMTNAEAIHYLHLIRAECDMTSMSIMRRRSWTNQQRVTAQENLYQQMDALTKAIVALEEKQ